MNNALDFSTRNKISFVINHFDGGGAARVMSLIADYFAKNNFEVQIVVMDDNIAKKALEVNYPFDNLIRLTNIKRTLKAPFHIIERIFKLKKVLKDSDIIVSFLTRVNIYVIISSMLFHSKVIVSDRSDLKSSLKNHFKYSFLMNIARFVIDLFYRCPQKLVFQTQDAKNYYSRAVQKKSVIIPNPLISNLPDKYEGERRKEIIAICGLNPQKNIKMTIDAYTLLGKEYPEFILTIYGEGELRRELEEYIDKLSLKEKIFLPGFKKDVHERVSNSYMYVSSSDYEGISNSMLEALGMGLPSIVTDCPVGGAKMFIQQNENGILVPVSDVQAMYEGMKKIIEDDKFRAKISANALKIREELSIDLICQKWLDLIREE